MSNVSVTVILSFHYCHVIIFKSILIFYNTLTCLTQATFKNMYASPRPTDSLKSLPTQKFLFEFPIEILFFSGISGPFRHRYFRFCILLQPKLLLIRLWEWFCKHVFRLLLVEMIASYKKRPRTWKIVIIKLNSFEKTF